MVRTVVQTMAIWEAPTMADIPVVEIMMTAKRRLVRPVTLIRDLATSVERLRLLNTTVTVSGKFVLKETCPSMWKI